MTESLGKILKRIRESRNLSIEEVSERSRIPKHIVSTLEEDRLDEIKSVFYTKSFVKTYAIFLGAMNEPGVKEYMSKSSREPQKKAEAVLRPTANLKKIPKIDFSVVNKYKRQISAVIISILVFWVLSFTIGRVVKFIKNIPLKKQAKVVKKEPLHDKGTAKAKPLSAERKPSISHSGVTRTPLKEKKEEAAIGKTDGIELEIFALDNTWLQVIGDGDMLFTGLFKKGSKDVWKAKKEIKLETGNSGVIKININGKPANFSGKKGEKKEIIITKDGIR